MNFLFSGLKSHFELIWLIQIVVKATLVLAVAVITVAMLRNASAATRHLVWSAAFCLLLILPVSSRLLPSLDFDILPESSKVSSLIQVSDTDMLSGLGNDSNRKKSDSTSGLTANPGEQIDQSALSLKILILFAWLMGTITVISKTLIGMMGSVWFKHTGVPLKNDEWFGLLRCAKDMLGIKRPISITMSEHVQVPVAFGMIRPAILIPKMAESWPEEQRRTIIIHELAHIKRLDHLSNLIARLACALYWFNPLVWVAARLLYLERELSADDLVMRIGVENHDYARQLLEIARSLSNKKHPSPGLNAILHKTQLKHRMNYILSNRNHRDQLTRKSICCTLTGTLLITLPLSAIQVPTNHEPTGRFRSFAEWVVENRLSGYNDMNAIPASHALSEWGAKPAVGRLTESLNTMNIPGKMAALWTLGEIGSKKSFSPVLNMLADSHPGLRSAALFALKGIGCDPAFVAITIALKDNDAHVREMAARMLGNLTHKPFDRPILEVLAEYGPGYPGYFRRTLGQIENRTAIDYLILAMSDPDPMVRASARKTLFKINPQWSMNSATNTD